jgi:hypothetical protein
MLPELEDGCLWVSGTMLATTEQSGHGDAPLSPLLDTLSSLFRRTLSWTSMDMRFDPNPVYFTPPTTLIMTFKQWVMRQSERYRSQHGMCADRKH